MEAKAQARFIRVTPQKSRRVVNEVRGKRVLEAADILRFAPQAVATDVRKVLLREVINIRIDFGKSHFFSYFIELGHYPFGQVLHCTAALIKCPGGLPYLVIK